MDPYSVLLLTLAGLIAGFLAGLVGVGGGIVFAPVLFFYFGHIGISPSILAQLTVGSSLFCTFIAALTSAVSHHRGKLVDLRIALTVGAFSALAVFLMSRFVTTRPWYDGTVFQIVFSVVLLAVVIRMLVQSETREAGAAAGGHPWTVLFATGSAAGAVAAAAGVGGGVVLVPGYHRLLRLPMQRAIGTSSATIVVISLMGVLTYILLGWSAATPAGSLGFVDFGHSVILAGASILSAQSGAYAAHRLPTRVLRYSFALIASVVAMRLVYGALSSIL